VTVPGQPRPKELELEALKKEGEGEE